MLNTPTNCSVLALELMCHDNKVESNLKMSSFSVKGSHHAAEAGAGNTGLYQQ